MNKRPDVYVAEVCDDRHERLALGELHLSAVGKHTFRIIESQRDEEYVAQHAKFAFPIGRFRPRRSIRMGNVSICAAADLPSVAHLHFEIEPAPKVAKFSTS